MVNIKVTRARLRAAGLILGASAPLAAAAGNESGVAELPPVVVQGTVRPDATAPSARRERDRLRNVPGASAVSTMEDETRMGSLRDAMGYVPGVVIQDFSGGIDQPRFNIRGSGIQSNPISRGVLLLQDGLPLNEADGSFIIGTLEPRDAAWFSVLKGANARNVAANTLGGEVAFRSRTGLDETIHARAELGSFGRRGWQAALGGAGERLDGHFSFSADDYDGFRHHSESHRRALRANVGVRLDNGLENRTYLSYTDLKFDIPFVVPGDRLQHRPREIMGDGNTPQDRLQNVYQRDPWRSVEQWRLANLTAWRMGAADHTLGVYYQRTDDGFKNLLVDTPTRTHTMGAQWTMAGEAAGFDYQLSVGADHSGMDRQFYPVSPQDGHRLARFGDYEMSARNLNAGLDLARDLSSTWRLDTGVRFTHATRDVHDRDSARALDQSWSWLSPRLGVIWKPSEDFRAFINLSWHREAPSFWEIVSSDVSAANPAINGTTLNRLREQRARSLEIGGQGRLTSGLQWDIALYRSEITDELIAVTGAAGLRTGTYNYADATRHQGVELGLRGEISQWAYRVAWTYSDFRFRDGVLAGKRIAGVPVHLVTAEAMYRTGKWELGGNLYWSPRAAPVDHMNTPELAASPYAIVGLKAVYRPAADWRVYAQVDNLTNKRYASSYVTRYQASSTQPTFTSGNGRSVSVGLSYQF